MTSELRQVAVVTVAYCSADDIGGFLESVATSGERPTATIMADNPSPESEKTIEIAEAAGATVVRLTKNAGYGGAINAAVATLAPEVEFLLISNPDVRLHPESVRRLVNAMDRVPTAGAIGPKILNEDGSVYPSARLIPSLRTGLGHALFFQVWPTNPWTRAYRQEGESQEISRAVGWLSGACLLVRRAAFDEVGGFDDGYFMYFEDVDLGFRLGRASWINLYEPRAVVTHVGGRSTEKMRPEMLRAHHRSADRFLSSKYRGWYLAPMRWALHIGLEVRARWQTRD
jgi:N-acetylglucosaminyl-diphospho-decaprenol L-rhamnosyltransferase